MNHYEFIINSRPDTLQITITQSYVNMLFNNGRFAPAKEVISAFRNRGDNAEFFMEAKLRQINEKLSAR